MLHPEGIACEEEFKQSLASKLCESTDVKHDFTSLVNCCQIHKCNNFCMRFTKDGKMRYCRCGCGVEKEKYSNETEGFPLQDEDSIVVDTNTKIKHLKLKRKTSRRMTQCSRYLLQSWRANCDIQLLIYDSNPDKPNLEEIRRVTDYVVSYTTKVNQSIPEERKVIKEIINNCENQTENDVNDLRLICRQVLNSFHNKRIISRSEAMVEIAQLPLIICSETIEPLNISSITKITKQPQTTNNIIRTYKNRKSDFDLSLIEFFHKHHKQTRLDPAKKIIPHPIGRLTYPKFKKTREDIIEPCDEYMKSTLILHCPWRGDDMQKAINSKNYLKQNFESFLKSSHCPTSIINRHFIALNARKNSLQSTFLDSSMYRDFVDTTAYDYQPSTDEDEENFFQFLRTKGKGLRKIDGYNVFVDYEYRWDLQQCIVSTNKTSIFCNRTFINILMNIRFFYYRIIR